MSYAKRGYDRRHSAHYRFTKEWQRFRSEILKHRPICEIPGCGRSSTQVDHRTSVFQGGVVFDARNAQALCTTHHARKTVMFDGGWGKQRRPYDPRALRAEGCDANGLPRDPLHPWNAAHPKKRSGTPEEQQDDAHDVT